MPKIIVLGERHVATLFGVKRYIALSRFYLDICFLGSREESARSILRAALVSAASSLSLPPPL